jgi:hypothetical protein
MKLTGRFASIAAVARFAEYRSRKAREQLHAASCEGGASGERTASSIVMKDPYLVQSILDFVGPGLHLYISTVSKLVGQCYGTVRAIDLQVHRLSDGAKQQVIVSPQMTLHSEMCKSESRLRLAVECGVNLAAQGSTLQRAADRLLAACSSGYRHRLEVRDAQIWQRKALGRYADKALLTFAYDHLGLPYFSTNVIIGAVMSGDLDKLQWLHLKMNVPLRVDSSFVAALFGCTNILQWFYKLKLPIHPTTCVAAACFGHLNVLQLLHAEAHGWHDDTYPEAVRAGHLKVAQWLSEHGCAFNVTLMTRQAAYFGHVDVLDWLLQQEGAQLDAEVMRAAAAGGQLLMCQHLHSIGCAWDPLVCAAAAHNSHLSVLQYLHEHGCPFDVQTCWSAVQGGNVQIIHYLIEHSLANAAVNMMYTLLFAGANSQLAVAQWLRERGAEWPQALYYSIDVVSKMYQWSGILYYIISSLR